ncbi:MAG: succinate dehydrogenase, hydrophobic membrane anchor protein [Reyranellaceae bacterium]
MADLRSPLARVRGLGSAKEGTHHWWAQRLTALALIPLTIWFVVSLIAHTGADHAAAAAWVGSLWPAALLILTVVLTFHHGQLGLQVVIEDYVHNEALKIAGILAVKGLALLLSVVAIAAIARIAIGG